MTMNFIEMDKLSDQTSKPKVAQTLAKSESKTRIAPENLPANLPVAKGYPSEEDVKWEETDPLKFLISNLIR